MHKVKSIAFMAWLLTVLSTAYGNQISEDQQKWVPKYERQANVPAPGEMLINTDAEPDLTSGFVELYNQKSLDGWTPRGGHCTFEARGESIVGTCVPESPSTYLSTVKDDYTDFVLTCELKWEADGNSGIMIRAQSKEENGKEIVFGPQAEMEAFSKKRFWSGGIYGQSCGGWYYPLWLDAHKEVRNAMRKDAWNRITVKAQGNVVKTWLNGLPAAHWETETYQRGFFGLQIHAGKESKVHFRNIRVKELDSSGQ